MRRLTRAGSLAVAAILAGLPALAQTTAGTNAPPASNAAVAAPAATHADAPTRANPAVSADRNTALTDSGDVRASKVIGSAVYNDRNEKVGSIDDLVIGRDNKPLTAIISVGGFLGTGTKHVAVPYTALKFGDTSTGNRVVMPGASKDSLKSMNDYHLSSAHRDAGQHRG